jgi:uncharacterized membrane protein
MKHFLCCGLLITGCKVTCVYDYVIAMFSLLGWLVDLIFDDMVVFWPRLSQFLAISVPRIIIAALFQKYNYSTPWALRMGILRIITIIFDIGVLIAIVICKSICCNYLVFEAECERTDAVATGVILGIYISIDTYLAAILFSYYKHPDYVPLKANCNKFGDIKGFQYSKCKNNPQLGINAHQSHSR